MGAAVDDGHCGQWVGVVGCCESVFFWVRSDSIA